jgi:DNA-binding transcriptional regulator LsrR (DeoR family)
MENVKLSGKREDLLAFVGELYYLEGLNQSEIARIVGVTRSMVSRMLGEARSRGLVEIFVHRPVSRDGEMEDALVQKFNLQGAQVLLQLAQHDPRYLTRLGSLAASAMPQVLKPGCLMGVVWGTSVSATIDALQCLSDLKDLGVNVVQLVGALGSRTREYNGYELVRRSAKYLGGEGYYLSAPFFLNSLETVKALMENKSINETLRMARQCDVALLGIGSPQPEFASFYLAGDMSIEELAELIASGAVGGICGLHFDLNGEIVGKDFSKRSVTIGVDELLHIPVRVGVAGGSGKVKPILGALRGGYITHLVTDSLTAKQVLGLAS